MSHNKSPLRIVYIGGIEHSGSTLLGLMLDNHPQITCVGELSHLARVGWLGADYCSCGLQIACCPFWTKVRKEWEQTTDDKITTLVKLEDAIDRNRHLPVMLFQKKHHPPLFKKYSRSSLALFQAIQQISGDTILVDTSKRVSRAFALSKIEDIDFRLIHLIRDARGVAYSSGKPNRAIRRSLWMSAVRWNLVNKSYRYVQKTLGDDRVMLVRYEELISKPNEMLRRIGNFIGTDLGSLGQAISQKRPLVAGHIGAGNAFLQRENVVALRTSVQWKQEMSTEKQNKVWNLTKREMKQYGYQK